MFNLIKYLFAPRNYDKRNDRIWKAYKLDGSNLADKIRILYQPMLLDDLEEEGIDSLDPTKTLFIFGHTYGGDTYVLRNLDMAVTTEQENIIIETVVRLRDKNLKSERSRYNEIYKFVEVYSILGPLNIKRTSFRRMKGRKTQFASFSIGIHPLTSLKNLEF